MLRRTAREYAAAYPGQPTPAQSADRAVEARWLQVFLLERRATLRYGYDDNDRIHTTENPYVSYPRADSLLEILQSGELDLEGRVAFTYFGQNFVLP
jgi:hypothetical protein